MPESHGSSADIGDYMKVFACTAVIMQSVLSLILTVTPNEQTQNTIGFIYNLVKFTAPTFIFGILYTTTRTTSNNAIHNYGNYLRKQFSALFTPTICWTTIYLLVLPQVQQVNHFNNLKSFIWQFINGNAAPHLWYNTMMLQFILLMPIFWLIARWLENAPNHAVITIIMTIIFYGSWLFFYNVEIFHGPHMHSWYLLDRIFLSFIIYAIFGIIAWVYRRQFENFIKRSSLIFIILFPVLLFWTNQELISFGHPLNLANAPYYKLSMTLYSLTIIGLIASLAIYQLNHHSKARPLFHFLAIYAYRAYLSNVFWLQIIWKLGGHRLATNSPLLAVIVCYLSTWGLSFVSAYSFHIIWTKAKSTINKIVLQHSIE